MFPVLPLLIDLKKNSHFSSVYYTMQNDRLPVEKHAVTRQILSKSERASHGLVHFNLSL